MAENHELRELIYFASTQAEKLFRVQGVVLPMYHAITDTGRQIVTPAPDADKDVTVALIKRLFKQRNVVRYVFIDEAWILDTRADRLPKPEEWNTIQRHGLEHHPDRREILMFSAENQAGDMLMAHRYILRPEHGKAKLSSLKLLDMDGGTTAGRMVGLLSQ